MTSMVYGQGREKLILVTNNLDKVLLLLHTLMEIHTPSVYNKLQRFAPNNYCSSSGESIELLIDILTQYWCKKVYW